MAFKFTYDVNGGDGENLVFGDGYLELNDYIIGVNDGEYNFEYTDDSYRSIIPSRLYDNYSHLYPTRTGYRLMGWSRNSEASYNKDPHHYVDTSNPVMVLNNEVFYAVWQPLYCLTINILLPDGTRSDEAGSIELGYYGGDGDFIRLSNVTNYYYRDGSYRLLRNFEAGNGLTLDSITGATYQEISADEYGWIIDFNNYNATVTITTKIAEPQDIYISPNGDVYARSFNLLSELIEADGVNRNGVYISPEGDIYADEYIEEPPFRIIDGVVYAKSFNTGTPY